MAGLQHRTIQPTTWYNGHYMQGRSMWTCIYLSSIVCVEILAQPCFNENRSVSYCGAAFRRPVTADASLTLLFLFSRAIMVLNFSLLQARAQSASNMRSRHPAVSQNPRESDSRILGRQMALCSTVQAIFTSFCSNNSSLQQTQSRASVPVAQQMRMQHAHGSKAFQSKQGLTSISPQKKL